MGWSIKKPLGGNNSFARKLADPLGLAKGKEEVKPGVNPNDLVAAGRAAGSASADEKFGKANTGSNIENVVGRMGDRLDGSDPTTQALMQQKQQSQALAARGMAGRGVAGGVAIAAQEQAGRMKDVDIAAQAYTQNAANLKDYANINSNIAAAKGALEEGAVASQLASVRPEVVKPEKGLISSIFS